MCIRDRSIDATLARGFITTQNTGGIFLRGVVWKPHCQVILCLGALHLNAAYKLSRLDHETETVFTVLVQQFVSELRSATQNVLLGNWSDLVDTQRCILVSRCTANSRHRVPQTDIVDASRQTTTDCNRKTKSCQPCNVKHIQVTSSLAGIKINVHWPISTTFYTVSVHSYHKHNPTTEARFLMWCYISPF